MSYLMHRATPIAQQARGPRWVERLLAKRRPHGRPSATVSLLLRRLLDVFVGQVRPWQGHTRSAHRPSGDFYFDYERLCGGEPIERAVERIGRLADVELAASSRSFVDELSVRGIRIAIDLPTFGAAWTARDPRLCQSHGSRYAVWFDGLQIRIRDCMLIGTAGATRVPDSARSLCDLLESDPALATFLSVVQEALAEPA